MREVLEAERWVRREVKRMRTSKGSAIVVGLFWRSVGYGMESDGRCLTEVEREVKQVGRRCCVARKAWRPSWDRTSVQAVS